MRSTTVTRACAPIRSTVCGKTAAGSPGAPSHSSCNGSFERDARRNVDEDAAVLKRRCERGAAVGLRRDHAQMDRVHAGGIATPRIGERRQRHAVRRAGRSVEIDATAVDQTAGVLDRERRNVGAVRAAARGATRGGVVTRTRPLAQSSRPNGVFTAGTARRRAARARAGRRRPRRRSPPPRVPRSPRRARRPSARSLLRAPAAVDRNRRARDRAGGVAAQIRAQRPDFARIDEPPGRHLFQERALERVLIGDAAAVGGGEILRLSRDQFGIDRARTDRVGRDPGERAFERDALLKPTTPCLEAT